HVRAPHRENPPMTDQSVPQRRILSLDGYDFKALFLAGMAWLERHYQIVNQLNVFPVPDGDTGINMLLTMQSAYAELSGSDDPNAGSVVRKFAKGAVNGSRGNSGVILSQIWRGIAVALREHAEIDTRRFAEAWQRGTEFAYDAAPKPAREGTILTVARESADAIQALAEDEEDFVILFERLHAQAHETLQHTPELLPVLKEAGVIDSGGQGLVFIYEGMLRRVRGESIDADIDAAMLQAAAAVPARKPARVMSATEFGHPYDVQLLLSGRDLDVDRIRAAIEEMGDSAIVTGDGEAIVKVHVHVYDPGQPISYAARLGVVGDVVVENMYEQYLENIGADLPDALPPAPSVELEPGDVAVVTVVPGDGLARIFYEQGAARVVAGGQTMNPSVEEIFSAINQLPTGKVVVLPNNKNVVLAAQQAARKAKGKSVAVVPSHNVPQGISAMLYYANARLYQDQRRDLNGIVAGMRAALDEVVYGEVTHAVRNVNLNGVKAEEGQLIGLLEGDLVAAGEDAPAVVEAIIDRLAADDAYELVTLYYGDDVTAAEAEHLVSLLAGKFPDFTFEIVPGGQPHYLYLLSVE
ncbi:MAG: DAK2 domain-containing protein, partial [Anaerolineae bacterium]|nr:DAK2 domain-containing protein [Anaerolineae bacterium]